MYGQDARMDGDALRIRDAPAGIWKLTPECGTIGPR